MPRRKAGTLLPLENEILHAALLETSRGPASFHGFALAQAMRSDGGSGRLLAHGTLYKALGRLEEFGLLTSQWEDTEDGGRPRRRLYELTAAGRQAAQAAQAAAPSPASRSQLAPRPA